MKIFDIEHIFESHFCFCLIYTEMSENTYVCMILYNHHFLSCLSEISLESTFLLFKPNFPHENLKGHFYLWDVSEKNKSKTRPSKTKPFKNHHAYAQALNLDFSLTTFYSVGQSSSHPKRFSQMKHWCQ